MRPIKAFLYLDEYKMYSISSQIFEGLTDQIVHSREKETSESEQQKGPVASGRILADIAAERTQISEHRFLHDFAYTLFEEKLVDEGAVLEIQPGISPDWFGKLDAARFVKVRGTALITDVEVVTETMEKFNAIGEAITFVTNFATIKTAQEAADVSMKHTNDRNEKARIKQRVRSAVDIAALAKANGLHQDPDFVRHLTYLIRYGLAEELEIQLTVSPDEGPRVLFSASLDHKYLREPQSTIVRKFGRRPRKEFIIFGTIAQGIGERPQSDSNDDTNSDENMKQLLRKMMHSMIQIDESFSGKQDREVVIDPIAVYLEM